ncbi:MAG: DUF2067 family protein [Acidilobus sp.]
MRYEFTFTVRGINEEVLERLIDRISELLPAGSLKVEVRGEKVTVIVDGPARSADGVRLAIQRALSEVTPSRRYRNVVDVDKLTSAGSPLPVDLIVEALKKVGYDSAAEGRQVLTNAPTSVVMDVVKRVEASWAEASRLKDLSGASRKAIAFASYLTSRSPQELVEVGMRAGALTRSKTNKILTVGDWRTAAERIRRMIGIG